MKRTLMIITVAWFRGAPINADILRPAFVRSKQDA